MVARAMRKLKLLGWLFSFLFACGLVLLVNSHAELQAFAKSHSGLPFWLGLALLLAIPARIAALIAAYLLELLLVGWQRSALRMLGQPEASVRLDALAILVMLLLPHRRLGWLLSFGLLYLLDVFAAQHFALSFTHLLPAWGIQILCLVLFQSFLRYWMHRLEHSIPALWALHKFHHSADRMTLLTSARQTQFCKGFEEGLIFLPAALLSDPIAPPPALASPFFFLVVVYFAYQSLILINGYLCHSNLRTGYGWIGRWLIVSPRMHRLHHATAPEYHHKNFSFDLMFWDRIFGTYAACPADVEVADIPIGLQDSPFNHRPSIGGVMREYFVTTYVIFWQEIRKGLVACVPTRLRTNTA
jgi:sterol desaturase/sphingolipid hydroxylase (fatty acid hydroxylase superfamily)